MGDCDNRILVAASAFDACVVRGEVFLVWAAAWADSIRVTRSHFEPRRVLPERCSPVESDWLKIRSGFCETEARVAQGLTSIAFAISRPPISARLPPALLPRPGSGSSDEAG